MKFFRSTSWVATTVAIIAGAATAQAQDVAPTEPAPVTTEVAAPEATVETAPATSTGAAVVTSQRPEASKEQAEAEPLPEAEAPETGLAISMFADAYYNFDWNLPPKEALSYNGTRSHTSYVNNNGFGLAFLGLDASYTHDVVGATASLRFGSGADRLIGQGGNSGIANIWQAYGTWTPDDALTIDFGQFATIYGAEVGESWLNLNYTRGALYYYMQPFWHTGVRLAYQATDEIAIKAMVANGVNSPLDDDRSPGVGLQLAYTGESVSAYLGYFGEPIEPEAKNWSHFVDLVLVGSFDKLTVIFNGDLGVANPGEDADSLIYYGVSLAAGYAITDQFGIAARGEFLGAAEDYAAEFGKSLITGTLTLEYKPEEHFAIRLDNRLEMADADMFANGDSTFAVDPMSGDVSLVDGTGVYFSTTLGVVVHTN